MSTSNDLMPNARCLLRITVLAITALIAIPNAGLAVLGEPYTNCTSTYSPEFGKPLSSPPKDKVLIFQKDGIVLLVGFSPRTQKCEWLAVKGERGIRIPQSMISKMLQMNGKNVGGFKEVGTNMWMGGDGSSIAAIKDGALIIGTPPNS